MTGSEFNFPIPMRVWITDNVDPLLAADVARKLQLDARVARGTVERAENGPAIVLLAMQDLAEGADDARELIRRAAPGRPVLYGGTGDRDTLLEAINVWRVARVVPTDAPIRIVADALQAAHARLTLDTTLDMTATALRRETDRLTKAISELEQTQADLLHTERLTTIGRLTAGLSGALEDHQETLEIFEGLLAQAAGDPSLEDLLRSAQQGVEGIGALLSEIQAYAHGEQREHAPKPDPLDDIVARTITFSRYDELMSGRSLHTELDSRCQVDADRHALYHVLLNLIRNALQATRDGGVVDVRTYRAADWACIDVEDNGSGMTREVCDRIFEPFFSTKSEAGLGLGLGTARRVIDRHGGLITCTSREGHGTRFTIKLPALN